MKGGAQPGCLVQGRRRRSVESPERRSVGGSSNEAADRRDAQNDIIKSALANGASYSEAGALAGVDARTVQRRMTDPSFRATVSKHRTDMVSQLTGRLVAGSGDALEVIAREMRQGQRSADRIRAASLYLTLSLRFHDQSNLEARMRKVEHQLGLSDHTDEDDRTDDHG